MMSGLMGTMAQGMAFGTGSAIAHRAVGAAAGALSGSGGSEAPAPAAPAAPAASGASAGYCDLHNEDLMACLKQPGADASACQPYFDALQQCQDQAKQFA